MIRKWLSALLVLAMLISATPVQALSVGTGDDVAISSVQEVYELPEQTFINPEYAHLAPPEKTEEIGSLQYAELDFSRGGYPAEEDAAKQVREAMKKRKTTFEVYFYTYKNPEEVDLSTYFWAAMEHTGNPTEGDYLYHQWHKFGSEGSCRQNILNGVVVWEITATYMITYLTDAAQEAEMDVAVAGLLDELDVWCADDYTKFITVYDYLCSNITYDYDNLNDTEYLLKHAAYAALIHKTAVCQGYAVLLYRLMLELGVDCRYISGTGNGGAHGWNIVELDGKYYNADATWDAIYRQVGLDYQWCLQSQENFADHLRDAEYATAAFQQSYPIGTANYVYSGDGSSKHNYRTVVTPPDCTAQGYTTYTCKVCTDSYVGNYVDATGHTYVNGVCATCNEVQIIASGTCGSTMTWKLDYTGTLTISGTDYMMDCASGAATPWYSNRKSIKSVVIESGVKSIGRMAFNNCDNLTSITIPETVNSIGHYAFYNCTALTQVTIPALVTVVGDYTFYNCTGLADVSIPNAVTYIGKYAFYNCASLTDITIPSGVTTISDYAFYFCKALTQITIPGSVKTIGDRAFSECDALSGIWVAANNGKYSNDSRGVLFSKDKSALIQAPGSLSGDYTIPESVITVENHAFYKCAGLTQVTIPDSVIAIGDYAFGGCTALADVYYAGTAEQWTQISVGHNNDPLQDADVHTKIIYGDATGDGVVDSLDVIRLKKYLAAYDYETNTSTVDIDAGADATGDGVIDSLDVIRLKKYLANFNYDTGTSTIPLGPQ